MRKTQSGKIPVGIYIEAKSNDLMIYINNKKPWWKHKPILFVKKEHFLFLPLNEPNLINSYQLMVKEENSSKFVEISNFGEVIYNENR